MLEVQGMLGLGDQVVVLMGVPETCSSELGRAQGRRSRDSIYSGSGNDLNTAEGLLTIQRSLELGFKVEVPQHVLEVVVKVVFVEDEYGLSPSEFCLNESDPSYSPGPVTLPTLECSRSLVVVRWKCMR